MLSANHLRNCKVLEDRVTLLEEIPKRGVCVELGVLHGEFSQHILETVEPLELHLVDVNADSIETVRSRFMREIDDGVVHLHHQDSSGMLLSMPDSTFDWIYIDADHSYESVKRDLEAAHRKLKPEGLITLNDYIYFSPSEMTKYGVIEATNEFCVDYGYELVHLAMQGRTYNDVTIRRLGGEQNSELA